MDKMKLFGSRAWLGVRQNPQYLGLLIGWILVALMLFRCV